MKYPKETIASAWRSITTSNTRSGFRPIEDKQRQPSSSGLAAIELGPLSPSPSHTKSRHEVNPKSRAGFTTKSLSFMGKRKTFRHGWRFGAINCAIYVTIAFWLNLIFTAWGTAHKNTGQEVVFEDDCHKVNKLNTWLHLLINLTSTVLLSASNYCMQCLSAPTRSEVDWAHAKGWWLDIGIPSIRNLKFISKQRVLIWSILGLSSLPLHLFYNSIVYSSITSNDYVAINVPEAFKNDQECLNCDKIPIGASVSNAFDDLHNFTILSFTSKEREIGDYARQVVIDLHRKARNGELKRFDPKDCVTEYAKPIQSFRRNVLLVGSDDSFPSIDAERGSQFVRALFNDTRVYGISSFASIDGISNAKSVNINSTSMSVEEKPISRSVNEYSWICDERPTATLDLGWCLSHVDEAGWKVNGFKVDYCLSEKSTPLCKLHILLPVGWLVTCLNLLKALLIYYTAFIIKEEPMMTMGDAVASFIERPDPRTKNLCLLTMKDVKSKRPQFTLARRKPWIDKAARWKEVTSKTRRVTTIVTLMLALIIVSSLLSAGVIAMKADSQPMSLKTLVNMGFGAINPRTIISWSLVSTMENVLMANLAQPIISFLYFSYNGLFTCMLLGFEWSRYAYERKGLRVSSSPHGAQRSTYFLELPYRYSLPLMGLSGLLHWLVSQSIFLVAIDIYGITGGTAFFNNDSSFKSMSCGYSPIAIISVLVVGLVMVIAVIGFGYIPYKPGMNLAGSCSLAISAACHIEDWGPTDVYDVARAKLQWGVVGVGEDGVEHCAFSARDVKFPEDGKTYA